MIGPHEGIVAACAISPDALKNFAPAAGQLMALAFAVAICYPLTLLGLKMDKLRAKALKKTPPWIKKALACNAVVKKIASVDVESATPAVIKRIVEAAKKKLPRATPPNADAELGGEDEVTPAQFERFRSDANALYRSVGVEGRVVGSARRHAHSTHSSHHPRHHAQQTRRRSLCVQTVFLVWLAASIIAEMPATRDGASVPCSFAYVTSMPTHIGERRRGGLGANGFRRARVHHHL